MKENKENTLKVIGQNIKRIRLMKNLTQEGLAEKLDKSINFISLIDKQVVTDDEFITNSLNMFNREDKKIVKAIIDYIINSKK